MPRTRITTLPNEILIDIFHLACQVEEEDNDHPEEYNRAPLRLSSISKRFREVAIGSTILWSSIKVSRDAVKRVQVPPSHKAIPALPLLELHLERSGDRPLDISFLSWVDVESQRSFSRALEVLGKDIKRWRSIKIDLSIWWIRKSLSSLTQSPVEHPVAPLLTECTIIPRLGYGAPSFSYVDFDTMETSTQLPYIDIFPLISLNTSPNLSSLTWQGSYAALRQSNVAWCGLTKLVLRENIAVNQALMLLKLCQNLISFELDTTFRRASAIDCDRVCLPYLKELKIIGRASDTSLNSFFLRLLAPSLEKLMLQSEDGEDDAVQWFWAVLCFIIECKTSSTSAEEENGAAIANGLKSLILDGLSVSSYQIMRLLKKTPTLESLEIGQSDKVVTERDLHALTLRVDGNTNICPSLRSLKLYDCISSEDNALAQMLKSRITNAHLVPKAARLEEVRISWEWNECTEDTNAWKGHAEDFRFLKELKETKGPNKVHTSFTSIEERTNYLKRLLKYHL